MYNKNYGLAWKFARINVSCYHEVSWSLSSILWLFHENHICACTYVRACPPCPLELELEVAVSYLTWVLGTKL